MMNCKIRTFLALQILCCFFLTKHLQRRCLMDFTYFGVFDPDRGPRIDSIEPDSEWLDAFKYGLPSG